VSVGNLSVGGTGKTPVVAALARWLVDRGERPAILSRGYGRADERPGVVVVSDGARVIAGLSESGDEPLMLARTVAGAIVAVSPDRYLAGRLAETRLDATVHLLDDGFQHVQLARDLDVLVTTVGEIANGRVLPFGRLREPADAASRAQLLVVSGATAGAAAAEAWPLGVSLSCGTTRTLGVPYRVGIGAGTTRIDAGVPVVAVCGIAHPSRFFDDVKAAGYTVRATLPFADHHRFTSRDVGSIQQTVANVGAGAVVTTEKDAVRFEACGPLPFQLFALPVAIAFDPPDALFASVEALLARAPARTGGER
jgi:tetraacyldisaccharide 4'-kinase